MRVSVLSIVHKFRLSIKLPNRHELNHRVKKLISLIEIKQIDRHSKYIFPRSRSKKLIKVMDRLLNVNLLIFFGNNTFLGRIIGAIKGSAQSAESKLLLLNHSIFFIL